MRQHRLGNILVFAMIAGNVHPLLAQQSDASLSPSLSVPATIGTGALAGLAVTLAGSPGFGLRASGHLALKNTSESTLGASPWLRPWTADVDAVFALAGRPLGSRNRTVASYGFIGSGTSTATMSQRTLSPIVPPHNRHSAS